MVILFVIFDVDIKFVIFILCWMGFVIEYFFDFLYVFGWFLVGVGLVKRCRLICFIVF